MPRRLRVLVVEDDPAIQRVLKRILEREGHAPAVAADGHSALRMIKAHQPDVVLLDLRIPGATGKLLFQRMLEDHPQIGGRVVIMTGDPESNEDAAWFAAQGLPVIPKPLEFEELFATIKRIRSRSKDKDL